MEAAAAVGRSSSGVQMAVTPAQYHPGVTHSGNGSTWPPAPPNSPSPVPPSASIPPPPPVNGGSIGASTGKVNGAHDDLRIVGTDGVAEEQARLEAELSAARDRVAEAKRRAAAGDAELKAALREEAVAARQALAEMERRHHEAVDLVRTSAEAEVRRILGEARAAAGPAGPTPEPGRPTIADAG